MKKKYISFFLSVLIFLQMLSSAASASESPVVSAKSAILTDNSGNVLYEKDADEKMLIASTTKIMTALIVLENCDLNEEFVLEQKHIAVEGSSMYLKSGEIISVRELLYGLLLASGNDAASALAYHVSGSIEGFVKLMNVKAKELGLKNTSFDNPHGLDADNHYSTARDLAVLMAAALKNEEFVKISSTKSVSIGGRTLTNHNKLLATCDGVNSGKTGFTKKAGRTLVSSCSRNNMNLICVTLSDPDDWNDHANLYDWGFSEYKSYSLDKSVININPLTVISGKENEVSISLKKPKSYIINSEDTVTTKTILPKFVYAPVKKGDIAGRIDIYVNGKFKDSISLAFSESVRRQVPKKNIFKLFNSGV